jgi:hypothetical protein
MSLNDDRQISRPARLAAVTVRKLPIPNAMSGIQEAESTRVSTVAIRGRFSNGLPSRCGLGARRVNLATGLLSEAVYDRAVGTSQMVSAAASALGIRQVDILRKE